MFRALLAHLQEALHNDTWCIACVLCKLNKEWSGAPILVQPTDTTRKQYTECRLSSAP
jgi:hypothetical protein